MHHLGPRVLLVLITLSFFTASYSQTTTRTDILKRAASETAAKEQARYQQLQSLARQKGWDMVVKESNGKIKILVDVDMFGLPLYLSTDNNIAAAATIGTNTLWPGGNTGLDLNGSSANVKNKLAIWDGGKVRNTHVELNGRVVQRDAATALSDHATHVAGTMIASGVNPLAKGMSFGQQELIAYDFGNDASEMLGEAGGLLVSNHSYGFNAGWNFNDAQNRWEFLGRFDANEDYKFGYYSSQAQLWDSIAYLAPFYLIVKSAGNNRNENGPAVGQPYWRYNSSGTMADAGTRPAGISSNDSYDILSLNSTAKNILLVGAINPIPAGYSKPADVVMSAFSSWGPTDDGRIKPDVVADGVGLLSSIASSNSAYSSFSGTSMASPNASGSLLLLQEYYSRLHGASTFMRSATLKGLVIHTADEAGPNTGPDYQYGWGLINMKKAAAVITANNTTDLIKEQTLSNNDVFTLPVIATGNGAISATISWTDPKGDVDNSGPLNSTVSKLVNDLDIRITKGATTYRPWTLTPSVPAASATPGDNTLDNVEKIDLPDVIPGETYTIQVTHKATLARGSQAYSLIVSGVGGTAYCTSGPTSNGGARIDSVSFGNIQNKNIAGCTTYSNFTNLTGNMQAGQVLPLFIRLNSCDASIVDKMVKVFIDGNNDGDFEDAGETVATSTIINGNGDFNSSITVPAGLTPGKYTRLRIVMQETNSAAAITPCGTYSRGETQDYRILITTPANDVGVPGIVGPKSADCAEGAQYLTIRIRNYGNAAASNVPVTAVIKQGATTIATLNAVYTNSIDALTEVLYTFQTPFNMAGGTAYTFTAGTTMTGDQDASNNQVVTTITTNANTANPAGTAVICGASNAILNATPATADLFNWYTSPTATIPVASGSSTSTTTIAPTYYLSKNEVGGRLGVANKMVFADGGYNAFSGNMIRVTASMPATIETARMYIGNSGKITFFLRQIVSFNETTGAYTYQPVSSVTLNVTATAPTPPVLNTQVNDPNDLGAVYYLGLDIPSAGNYGIVIQCENGASIYRNNNITTNPYPFTLPNIISITGNSAIQAGDPNFFQKFYYFLYDATVKIAGCPSGRTTITATNFTAPTITLAGNVLTSTAAASYQWFRGNVLIPGAINQTYTATESGVYRVEATYNGGCTLSSTDINFTATAVSNVDPGEIGLIVSPNPATNGQFTIQLETNTRSTLSVSLLNTTGQRVYNKVMANFIGRLTLPVNLGKPGAGVYYLQVLHDKKMYIKKVLITN